MWYLEHKRENIRITCNSYDQAVSELYRQWRDKDGSIPWEIFFKINEKRA